MIEAFFTPEQLAEVRAYHAPAYLWSAVGDLFELGLYLLLLRFGTRPLFRQAERLASVLERRSIGLRGLPGLRVIPKVLERLWRGPGWGAALLFSLMIFAVFQIAFAPVHVYLSFINEHRYGLSNYTLAAWGLDQLKGLVTIALAQSALCFGLYGLARSLRSWWWVLGISCSLLLLLAPLLDPFRDQLYFRQQPLSAGPLRTSIVTLLEKAGVEYREIIVEETSRASVRVQAYFAGQGPTRTIVLNDSLVDRFTKAEVLAAVAHEASHVHESRWPGRVASGLTLIGFLFVLHLLFRTAEKRHWLGCEHYADIRTLPLISVAMFVLLNVGAPISGYFSRERERAADAYALKLTQDPIAFEQMLLKATRINKMDPDPPRWLVWRGLSHPSPLERLTAAQHFEKQAAGK